MEVKIRRNSCATTEWHSEQQFRISKQFYSSSNTRQSFLNASIYSTRVTRNGRFKLPNVTGVDRQLFNVKTDLSLSERPITAVIHIEYRSLRHASQASCTGRQLKQWTCHFTASPLVDKSEHFLPLPKNKYDAGAAIRKVRHTSNAYHLHSTESWQNDPQICEVYYAVIIAQKNYCNKIN